MIVVNGNIIEVWLHPRNNRPRVIIVCGTYAALDRRNRQPARPVGRSLRVRFIARGGKLFASSYVNRTEPATIVRYSNIRRDDGQSIRVPDDEGYIEIIYLST